MDADFWLLTSGSAWNRGILRAPPLASIRHRRRSRCRCRCFNVGPARGAAAARRGPSCTGVRPVPHRPCTCALGLAWLLRGCWVCCREVVGRDGWVALPLPKLVV